MNFNRFTSDRIPSNSNSFNDFNSTNDFDLPGNNMFLDRESSPVSAALHRSPYFRSTLTPIDDDDLSIGSFPRSIPIKIVHEKSDSPVATLTHESTQQEMSDRNDSQSAEDECEPHQPRVHQIPIQIESSPRSLTSSPKLSSSPRFLRQQSPQPAHQTSSPSPIVHNIPIRIERSDDDSRITANNNQKPHIVQAAPFPGQTGSVFKRSQAAHQTAPNADTGATRIPIRKEHHSNFQHDEQMVQHHPQPQPPPKKDPMDELKEIRDEVEKLSTGVQTFQGEKNDKQYRYLDEMLTRCMLRLDTIDSEGRDEVRQTRKSIIAYIDRTLTELEAKVNTRSKESMEAESIVGNDAITKIEPDSTETQAGIDSQEMTSETQVEANEVAMAVVETIEDINTPESEINPALESVDEPICAADADVPTAIINPAGKKRKTDEEQAVVCDVNS